EQPTNTAAAASTSSAGTVNMEVSFWDDMEKLYHHTFFNELRTDPDISALTTNAVVVTEPPLNPRRNREQMTTIMFETFKIPALMLANSSVMALYGTGRTTGCVLESGDTISTAVPVYEGYSIPHAVQR